MRTKEPGSCWLQKWWYVGDKWYNVVLAVVVSWNVSDFECIELNRSK